MRHTRISAQSLIFFHSYNIFTFMLGDPEGLTILAIGNKGSNVISISHYQGKLLEFQLVIVFGLQSDGLPIFIFWPSPKEFLIGVWIFATNRDVAMHGTLDIEYSSFLKSLFKGVIGW